MPTARRCRVQHLTPWQLRSPYPGYIETHPWFPHGIANTSWVNHANNAAIRCGLMIGIQAWVIGSRFDKVTDRAGTSPDAAFAWIGRRGE